MVLHILSHTVILVSKLIHSILYVYRISRLFIYVYENVFINYLKLKMINKFLHKIMLYFDRIGVSKGTDFNKTKECNICHFW